MYDQRFDTQYLFGHLGLLVAPIVTKKNISSDLARYEVLVPAGRWIDIDSLQVYHNTAERILTVARTPSERGCVLVREGTVLPLALEPSQRMPHSTSDAADGRHPLLGGASELPRTLVFEAFIGNSTNGSGFVLEDDSRANAYMDMGSNASVIAATVANYSVDPAGTSLTFTIHPATGDFHGMPSVRNYEIRIRGAWGPTAVTAALTSRQTGKTASLPVLPNSPPHPGCGKVQCGAGQVPAASWWWDSVTLTASARIDHVAVSRDSVTATFTFGTTLHHRSLHSDGFYAAFPILGKRVMALKHTIDFEGWTGAEPSLALNNLTSTADRMQIFPETAADELDAYSERVRTVLNVHARGKGPGAPTVETWDFMQAWLLPPS